MLNSNPKIQKPTPHCMKRAMSNTAQTVCGSHAPFLAPFPTHTQQNGLHYKVPTPNEAHLADELSMLLPLRWEWWECSPAASPAAARSPV